MANIATDFLKEKNGASLRACQRILSDNFPSNLISHETVRAWSLRQEWGKPYKIQKAPMISAKNIADRLAFAQYLKA